VSRLIRAIGLATLGAVCACGSDSTSPNPTDQIPDFVYVSNQNGSDQLFTYKAGATALLSGSQAGDKDPQSAHGRIVFTGYRDSPTNSEIYSTKNDGSDLQRLTTSGALDFQPSPSPDGSQVAFASLRSGTSRLWIMDSDGSNPTAMTTGSQDYTPESAPRFSPDGAKILFNSARTGTSQLFVMPAAGGDGTQLTHELNGAFDGSWSADGASVLYVDGQNRTVIHELQVQGGAVSDYVTDGTDVGEQACTTALCLVVSGRTSAAGDIYAYVGPNDQNPTLLVGTSANERQPALLVP
jgi:dipeptidyl aminopeptidase/acylaminoacyl peptidase